MSWTRSVVTGLTVSTSPSKPACKSGAGVINAGAFVYSTGGLLLFPGKIRRFVISGPTICFASSSAALAF